MNEYKIYSSDGSEQAESALKALWRTSKAIIVGASLQVEQIVNVLKELLRRLLMH